MTLDERARSAAEKVQSRVAQAVIPDAGAVPARLTRRRFVRVLGSGLLLAAVVVGALGTFRTTDHDVSVNVRGGGTDAGDGDSQVGPRRVVADGEVDGVQWELEAYLSDRGICVDLAYHGGRGGGCGLGVPPRGVGVVRIQVDVTQAVFGAVSQDVTRVDAWHASGSTSTVSSVGGDAGFGIAFYVFFNLDDDPIDTVIAYDADGQEIDRINVEGLIGPSQSPEEAQRDGVIPTLARLPLAGRVEPYVSVAAPEGTWVLARPPESLHSAAADTGCRLGPADGVLNKDVICTSEYGEILLLDQRGQIERAYPMPSVPPSWLYVADDAVYAGRIGDGALPSSTLVRVDRTSREADITLFKAPDDNNRWPAPWRMANAQQVSKLTRLVGFAPTMTGTAASSNIGDVVVDVEGLREFFRVLP